ncbi:MAG: Jag N-terminal domain-containing protein [Campylobacterota bacterium]|nr:Jag N-terminal domain-containing protein [Campylobacterota bacterium]
MITIKAKTLEEAYAQASQKLECSITQMKIEIVQNPSSGFMGLFSKEAIIVAAIDEQSVEKPKKVEPKKPTIEKERVEPPKVAVEETTEIEEPEVVAVEEPQEAKKEVEEKKQPYEHHSTNMEDSFFEKPQESVDIVTQIEDDIKELFSTICFELDTIKVSMYDENILYIELAGADAALLIGKEGYRYKALSYMLFNWINSKYELQLRLEIAEFLKNQEESIDRYLDGVCENVDRDGRAQTKILDGVLVQIALKKLRSIYPQKYVAIRTTKDGNKYIIINHYNEY